MIHTIKRYEEFSNKKKRSTNEDHNETQNYMFFSSISNMRRMCDEILKMDPKKVDSLLSDGHDWATDHIATSKDDIEEVYGFLKSSMEMHHDDDEEMISDDENC